MLQRRSKEIMAKLNFIIVLLSFHYANGLFELVSYLFPVPRCITLDQSLRVTETLCHEHRQNKTLWSQVIECHRPITDEFMRSSPEALCPNPKFVDDPTNEKYSIEEVFFNICGMVDGSPLQILSTSACLTLGGGRISNHYNEIREVQRRWGKDVPCNIGKCVKGIGSNLGI